MAGSVIFCSCMKKQTVMPLPDVISFRTHIVPLFTASCVDDGCHSGKAAAANLNLTPDVAYAQLFLRKSIDTVIAGSSTLYTEIASGAMPKASRKLSSYDIGLVQKWIGQKAKNN